MIGVEQLLVADVLDLVALELAQRVADDGLLVDLASDRVDDEADGAPASRTADEQCDVHGSSARQISILMIFFIQHEPDEHQARSAPTEHDAARCVSVNSVAM